MHRPRVCRTLLALLVLPSLAHADVQPLSEEKRRDRATLIVSGRVGDVYARDAREEDEDGWRITRDYLAAFDVDAVLKDDGPGDGGRVEPGDRLFLSCWRVIRREGTVWTYGHEGRPATGETGTAYLDGSEEPYFILMPNGWAPDGEASADDTVVLVGADRAARRVDARPRSDGTPEPAPRPSGGAFDGLGFGSGLAAGGVIGAVLALLLGKRRRSASESPS